MVKIFTLTFNIFLSLCLNLAVAWAGAGGFSGHSRANFHNTTIAVPAVSEEPRFQHRQVQLPGWVTRVPENCFAGISLPSNSIQEARAGALDSAVTQVLQTMGAKYDFEYRSVATEGHDGIGRPVSVSVTDN
jgi:hypothetical protein